MPLVDVFRDSKKIRVMQETWGHLYPKPGFKYPGEMLIAIGEYRDEIIISSDFPNLAGSPYRYGMEDTIFDILHNKYDVEPGVYKVDCVLWFYKTEQALNKGVGRMIKIEIEEVDI